ncbi:MAG: DUF424 family protein [Candidatus Hadarchaeota archaeon]
MRLPLLRVVRSGHETIVVICDSKLLGKKFRKKKLKLEVKEHFYCGRDASVKECLEALEAATIANLVGSIVDEAVKAGMLDKNCVIRFKGAPHAQLVKM